MDSAGVESEIFLLEVSFSFSKSDLRDEICNTYQLSAFDVRVSVFRIIIHLNYKCILEPLLFYRLSTLVTKNFGTFLISDKALFSKI